MHILAPVVDGKVAAREVPLALKTLLLNSVTTV
jgi:hypothetical protein